MKPLTTPQVSYAKDVLRTSEELRALGESLQRLTLSNEILSLSNKTLTDILYFQVQGPHKIDLEFASAASLTDDRSLDGSNGNLCNTRFAVSASPETGSVRPQKSTGSDSTHDRLQRCMDSVQELAKTIACAMSAWQGQEKTGSSDIHGSHAKLVAELGKLPKELQCKQCFGRVLWTHFDLTKAASKCLGTCTCVSQTSPSLWRPCDTTVARADLRADSARWRQEQRIGPVARGSQSPRVTHQAGNIEPDTMPDYVGSETYRNSQAARVPRSRDGDSPAVETPYGSPVPSNRDRMPADRMAIDRMQDDRMQIDPPSGPPQDRRYQADRNGYPSDPRYGADTRGYPDARDVRDARTSYPPQEQPPFGRAAPVTSSYTQDSMYARSGASSSQPSDGAPPGYVRQGNYYVPISSAEQPRTDYESSHPFSQPAQPQRIDTREMRDARDVRGSRDLRDHRDPRYGQDYAQDPRYAYPGPATTTASLPRGEREAVVSPPQQRSRDTRDDTKAFPDARPIYPSHFPRWRNTAATGFAIETCEDGALDTGVVAGAISPHDGSSQSNNVPSVRKDDCADPDLSSESNTTQSSPAVQALLSRWLGDDASAVIRKAVN
jgi:hypothetical protein